MLFFSWAKPTLRLGMERSSEIIGLRFSDDLFIFKTTYDYILNIIVLIVNHDVILVLVV